MNYLNCPRCGYSARLARENWRGSSCPTCRRRDGVTQILFLSAHPDQRGRFFDRQGRSRPDVPPLGWDR